MIVQYDPEENAQGQIFGRRWEEGLPITKLHQSSSFTHLELVKSQNFHHAQ